MSVKFSIVLAVASVVAAGPGVLAQQQISSESAQDSTVRQSPTIEQFRRYLELSGVGESWRKRIVDAVDQQRSKGARYWPESFWTDVKDSLRKADLAMVVYEVYRDTYSYEKLDEVNKLLSNGGLAAYLASPIGAEFCSKWSGKDSEVEKRNFQMTYELIEAVYQKHKAEIKAARAKYIAAHPDWKD